jgi:CHAT domain-containing protein
VSINNLGALHRAMGDAVTARRYYERALAIDREALGENHPSTAITFNNLLAIYGKLEDWPAAAKAADRARRILRLHTQRVLPTLSEQEQLAFLKSVENSFEAALSLGLQRRGDEGLGALSAAWLINGKAGVQEALALAARLTGPAAEALLAQLRAVRDDLARASLKTPSPEQAKAHEQQLAALRRQEEALIRKLGELTLGRAVEEDLWIPLERVQEQLAPDAVLINLARFEVIDFQKGDKNTQWRPARYAAWLIPSAGRGPVKIVDLGDAATLDDAVRDVRRAIEDGAARIGQQGESAVERQTQEPLRRLANLVLTPLLPHLGGAKQLVISPDGQLWLVPWAALPLPDGRYAVEEYEIRHVVSGRELVEQDAPTFPPQTPLVMADPDFDFNLAQSPTKAAAQPAGAADPGLQRGSAELNTIPRFARLPGTAVEARASIPSLEQWAGVAPQVCTGAAALERVFKLARRPRVLTLSTHGFFLKDQEEGKIRENPLLRCGLVFAGCNRRSEVQAGDDGVLTGLEIVGVDLRGTELVVLSACETGVGEVRNGEGVAGLRQAFQLAGAEAVVASLWSVPDLETARLM